LIFAKLPGHLPWMTTVTDTFNFQIWDGNNIATWMSNNGAYATYRATGNSGLELAPRPEVILELYLMAAVHMNISEIKKIVDMRNKL